VGSCAIEPQVAAPPIWKGSEDLESQARKRETQLQNARNQPPKKRSAIYPWVVAHAATRALANIRSTWPCRKASEKQRAVIRTQAEEY